ncbi:hypothetical protein EV360DRAFT_51254, partial [Lentinula raphanica]
MTRPKSFPQKKLPKGSRTIDEATEERIEKAREDFLNTTKFKSQKAAAAHYQIPYHSFLRRLKGQSLPRKQAHESQSLLTDPEEKTLLEWMQYLAFSGLPLNKRTLRPKV